MMVQQKEIIAMPEEVFFRTFPVGPLQCNCCIIGDLTRRRALVVDPGGEAEQILRLLRDSQLELAAIIHTHGHLDHILASGELHQATGAPLYLHPEDRFLWDGLVAQCQALGIACKPLPAPQAWLRDELPLACCDGVTFHTPGHTPGSVSFWFSSLKLLVAGDTLFRGSVGRTDLPGGSFRQIERSIRERLYVLDGDVRVVPGHGGLTTIGEECRSNPFVSGL